MSVIEQHLDAMAMTKMNCLHWHMTDDQSFPWMSENLPELAVKGAFAPAAVYTSKQIRDVVEYARFRGIRVIPELDMPGGLGCPIVVVLERGRGGRAEVVLLKLVSFVNLHIPCWLVHVRRSHSELG